MLRYTTRWRLYVGSGNNEEKPGADGFTERLVQVRRVTKVVKGGKQLSFRAVVVAGNGQGEVGVGCASAKEVRNLGLADVTF